MNNKVNAASLKSSANNAYTKLPRNNDKPSTILSSKTANTRKKTLAFLDMSIIRGMAVEMNQKRQLRRQLLTDNWRTSANSLLVGFLEKHGQATKKLGEKCVDVLGRLELWGSTIKSIEGNYGGGVASYFFFLRSLLILNLCISVIWAVFVILPKSIAPSTHYVKQNGTAKSSNGTDCKWMTGEIRTEVSTCSAHYQEVVHNLTQAIGSLDVFKDAFAGEGWMEESLFFYGSYPPSSVKLLESTLGQNAVWYNFPVAYMVVFGSCILMSVFTLAKTSAEGIREAMIVNESFFDTCKLIFCAWDYGVRSKEFAKIKQAAVYSEICSLAADLRDADRWRNRPSTERWTVYGTRLAVNAVIVALLVGSGYAIYEATLYSATRRKMSTGLERLFISYLPSATLVALSTTLPVVFSLLSRLEQLSPAAGVKEGIIRCVLVRLSSLAVLVITLYYQLKCAESDTVPKDSCNVIINPTDACPKYYCWETAVGQSMHQLVLLDLFLKLLFTATLNIPCIVLSKHCGCQKITSRTFNISSKVLDLIYCQSLLWLGTFFSPMIPVIMVVNIVVQFYIDKSVLIHLCKPSTDMHRLAMSHNFFMVVLLGSFILSCLPLSYIIIKISPSTGCGPFRGYGIMYDVIPHTVCELSEGAQEAFRIITSAVVVLPLTIILCLALYYQCIISKGHKRHARELKYQLLTEKEAKTLLSSQIRTSVMQAMTREQTTVSSATHNTSLGNF